MTINEILEEEKKKLDSWKIFCNVEERMHGRISKSTLIDKEILEFKVSILEELIQYRSIGTVEECRAAVEKQRAKKPILSAPCKSINYYLCPNCGKILPINKPFCSECGSAVDWSDTP